MLIGEDHSMIEPVWNTKQFFQLLDVDNANATICCVGLKLVNLLRNHLGCLVSVLIG